MKPDREWEKWGYSAQHSRPSGLTALGLLLIVVSVYLIVALGGVVGFLGGFAFFFLAEMAFSASRWAYWWRSFRQRRSAKIK